jgi:hypothetical protein
MKIIFEIPYAIIVAYWIMIGILMLVNALLNFFKHDEEMNMKYNFWRWMIAFLISIPIYLSALGWI